MAAQIFSIAERPDLDERRGDIADPWPDFMNHDEVVRRWWPALYERFPEFQLVLYEPDTDVVLGAGCSVPIRWDDHAEGLPTRAVTSSPTSGCVIRLSARSGCR